MKKNTNPYKRGIFIFLLVIGVLLTIPTFQLLTQLELYLNKPSVSAWSSVNQVLYQQADPWQDAVIFTPDWLQGYATDLERFKYISILRKDRLFDSRVNLPKKIWVIRTHNNPSMADQLNKLGYLLNNRFSIKKIICELYINNKEAPIYDFAKNFHKAKSWVSFDNGINIAGILSNNNAFIYTGYTGTTIQNVVYSAGRERKNSIWFHPIAHAKKYIQFDQVPLNGTLEISLGLADSGRRYDKIRTCLFTILINGKEKLGQLKIDENCSDQYWEYDLTRFGKAGSITFLIEPFSEQDDGWRHIFFSATIKEK